MGIITMHLVEIIIMHLVFLKNIFEKILIFNNVLPYTHIGPMYQGHEFHNLTRGPHGQCIQFFLNKRWSTDEDFNGFIQFWEFQFPVQLLWRTGSGTSFGPQQKVLPLTRLST